MNILLVEDDENKRRQLATFIENNYSNAELKLAKSLQSGLRIVKAKTRTLILLDMTIPNYDPDSEESGGQTHNFGGRDFLRQLDRFDIKVPVIVVTQFETFGRSPAVLSLNDLDQQLVSEHSENYKGVVYYHAAISDWSSKLKQLIDKSVPTQTN